KAAHRNQLIDSIMRSIPEEKIELSLSKEEMETVPEGVMLKKRVEFDRRAGVVKKIYYEEPVYLKSGKLSDHPKEIVLKTEIDSDPNNITSYFLKNPVPWSDMLSYEKALAQLNSDNFKYPEIKERVIKHYEDYLDKYPNSFKIVTSH
ncbi:MAG: hypothetical protein EB119_04785, partial [Synechococcaceae bacterium WBB_34_004]|nr:hypothetical protein [Synechococcaceae bacterium WBB_34_004]